MRLKWLDKALQDLAEVTEYIAQEDLDTAKRVASYIRERAGELSRQPNMGRPGRAPGTRELVVDKFPFIIPYRVKDGELQILRIFHTSRKPPRK